MTRDELEREMQRLYSELHPEDRVAIDRYEQKFKAMSPSERDCEVQKANDELQHIRGRHRKVRILWAYLLVCWLTLLVCFLVLRAMGLIRPAVWTLVFWILLSIGLSVRAGWRKPY